MDVDSQINHIFQLGGWLKLWVNPYASTESQKILFPQQYLQRNKTNMTLFQVALPSILDYLHELKRSGPLLGLLRLRLLSLSAWNSQVEIFSVLNHPTLLRSSLKDPCNLSSGWGVGPPVKRQYQPYLLGLLLCYQPVSTYPLCYFCREAVRVSYESGRHVMTQACSAVAQAMPADFLSFPQYISQRVFFHMFTKHCTLLEPGWLMLVLGEQIFSLPWTLESSFR